MSNNNYRRTEAHFRRMEEILFEAIMAPEPEEWIMNHRLWRPATLQINLTFALTYLLEHPSLLTNIPYEQAKRRSDKYCFGVVTPNLFHGNSYSAVTWKARTKNRSAPTRMIDFVNEFNRNDPLKAVELMHIHDYNVDDIDLFKSIVSCIAKRIIREGVMLWGVLTDEHTKLLLPGTCATQMQRDGRPYVLLLWE